MVKEIKENYKVVIITGFVTMVFMIMGEWFLTGSSKVENSATIDYVDKKDSEINNCVSKKADITYVDDQNKSVKELLNNKADKSLVESMDKKLDLILQKLD